VKTSGSEGLNRTIAVIDDDASVRKAFGRLLCAVGFEVNVYASGEEFLEACAGPLPDCAVLDMHMPGLSGLELQSRLNAMGVRIALIVITADVDLLAQRAFMESNAVAYLRKPVDGPTLLDYVEQAIALAQKQALPAAPLAANAS
jgi:FixJ family two-component response regulator